MDQSWGQAGFDQRQVLVRSANCGSGRPRERYLEHRNPKFRESVYLLSILKYWQRAWHIQRSQYVFILWKSKYHEEWSAAASVVNDINALSWGFTGVLPRTSFKEGLTAPTTDCTISTFRDVLGNRAPRPKSHPFQGGPCLMSIDAGIQRVSRFSLAPGASTKRVVRTACRLSFFFG